MFIFFQNICIWTFALSFILKIMIHVALDYKIYGQLTIGSGQLAPIELFFPYQKSVSVDLILLKRICNWCYFCFISIFSVLIFMGVIKMVVYV